MLKNAFRRLVGGLVLILFGVAVFQFSRQTSGNPYVLNALASGMTLIAVLCVVIGLAWWVDRRQRGRGD